MVAPFVGSFLGLLAVRMPAGEGVVKGRSRCRSCGVTLSACDLIPILSWFLLHGRCRNCSALIATTHVVLEICALVVAIWSVLAVPPHFVWLTCLFGWWLLVLAACDARSLVLPLSLTLPLVLAGILASFVRPDIDPVTVVLGAIAGYGAFTVVSWCYRRLRGRDGLGGGDAVLLAAAGSWVGLWGLPSVVLVAAVSGLCEALVKYCLVGTLRRDSVLAFGPHLCLGSWLIWLYGPLTLIAPF